MHIYILLLTTEIIIIDQRPPLGPPPLAPPKNLPFGLGLVAEDKPNEFSCINILTLMVYQMPSDLSAV